MLKRNDLKHHILYDFLLATRWLYTLLLQLEISMNCGREINPITTCRFSSSGGGEAVISKIMAQDMTLLWGSGSPPCWRVMIALEEKNLQGYNQKLLSFEKMEHKSQEVIDINPRGQVWCSVSVIH